MLLIAITKPMASKNEELLAKGLERVWSHGEVALFVSQGALQAQDRERLLKTDSDNLTLTTTTANQIGLERSWAGSLAPKIKLDALAGEVEVRVPPATPHQLYSRFKGGVLYLSNLCDAIPGEDIIEPAALYSLLQFGAIVPPFSTKASVRRLAPGVLTIFDLATQRIKARTASPDSLLAYSLAQEPAGIQKIEAELERELAAAIDQSMLSACPDGRAIILFSGGVDSALLASRAKKLGWEDTRLVHLSFGAEDPETKIAREIAKELGLFFDVVEFKGSAVDVARGVLRGPVPPFADHSLIPTSLLMKEIQERFGSEFVVFDGTGADGGFGMEPKITRWQRIYQVPQHLRMALGFTYQGLNLATKPGRREVLFKTFRRAGELGFVKGAIMAQNPLSNIAFRFAPAVQEAALLSVDRWVQEALPDGKVMQAIGMDLMFVCAGIFAQKSVWAERKSGVHVFHPFHAAPILEFMVRNHDRIYRLEEPKKLLKGLLSDEVSSEYIYRSKVGFPAPLVELIRTGAMGDIIESAVRAPNNILRKYLLDDEIKSYLARAAKGKDLPPQTLNLIWSVIAASVWLEAHPRTIAN